MAAPKLSQLLRSNVRELAGNLEIICSLGCGNIIKYYVHVTVMPIGVTAEPISGARSEEKAQPTLDLRICPACWGIYVYDQSEVHREIMQKVQKRSG